jgi:peptidyl-dipeptidase A
MIALLLSLLLAVPSHAAAPTVKDAQAFMDRAEKSLETLGRRSAFSAWAMQTNINYSTEWLAGDADNAYSAEAARLAREARQFDTLKLPADLARKFLMLKLTVVAPAPPS